MAARASFESSMISTRGVAGAAGFFTARAGVVVRLEAFGLVLIRIEDTTIRGCNYIGSDYLVLIIELHFGNCKFRYHTLKAIEPISGRLFHCSRRIRIVNAGLWRSAWCYREKVQRSSVPINPVRVQLVSAGAK